MNKQEIKTQKKYYGFTLVELIIVITILAILATIAFVSFNSYVKDSRDSKRLADINQIKKGVEIYKESFSKTPIPDQAKSFTGGKNTLYVGKINNKVLSNLSKDTFDPLSKQEYIYATFGTGEYFQIGTFSENDLSYNVIDKTYADYKTAIVEGNYLFDPSLPSLLISSGTTLYDPNNCFIINGFNNGLENNTNCLPKNKMSLNNYDKSLVGYWDMETTSGINILKDLSGNNNNGNFTGSLNYSSSLTGGLLGKGIKFNGVGLISIPNSTSLGDINSSITISTLIKTPDKNSLKFIINKYDKTFINGYEKPGYHLIVGNNSSGTGYVLGGRLGQPLPGQYVRIEPINFNINQYELLTGVIENGKMKIYINGKKYGESVFNVGLGIKNTSDLGIGGNTNNNLYRYNGIIDEVKIYNRALSDLEILNQAKVLGL